MSAIVQYGNLHFGLLNGRLRLEKQSHITQAQEARIISCHTMMTMHFSTSRMTWNVSLYWSQCTKRNVHSSWKQPRKMGIWEKVAKCSFAMGKHLKYRNEILKSLKPVACGCGKSAKIENCCVPGKSNSCSCVKNGTACTYRCKCTRVKCHFLAAVQATQMELNNNRTCCSRTQDDVRLRFTE